MTTKYAVVEEKNIRLNTDRLPIGKPLVFDVFENEKGNEKLLFSKGTVFSTFVKDSLKDRGIADLYISEEDASLLKHFLLRAEGRSSLYDDGGLKEYSYNKEQHYQIDIASLMHGSEINFSVFLLNKSDFRPVIEANEKAPVKIDKSVLSGLEGDIVIRKKDIPHYRDFLASLRMEGISETDRSKIEAIVLKENTKTIIQDLFSNPLSRENLKASKGLVVKIIECFLKNKNVIHDLLSVKSYDHYTYTHSLNVAVLSIGLGLAIGLENDKIEKLGVGAMLHDIGKSAISLEILNKQGRLKYNEFLIYKNHVIEGEKILHEHQDISEESIDVVLQHHEKLSGKGYPLNLAGDNIKIFGRIAAIADCFDALTTPRLFKQAVLPYEALLIISKEKKDHDQDLLKEFINMLSHMK